VLFRKSHLLTKSVVDGQNMSHPIAGLPEDYMVDIPSNLYNLQPLNWGEGGMMGAVQSRPEYTRMVSWAYCENMHDCVSHVFPSSDRYQLKSIGLEVEDKSGLDGSRMNVLVAIAGNSAYASSFPSLLATAAGACSYRQWCVLMVCPSAL
jgi:hypothetical protein